MWELICEASGFRTLEYFLRSARELSSVDHLRADIATASSESHYSHYSPSSKLNEGVKG